MQTSGRGFRTILMVSSIVLLFVLEFFWLASTYKDAYGNFRRETSSVLRATVFTLRDSIFIKSIDPLSLERMLRDTVQSNLDAMPAGAVNRDTLGSRHAFHKQIENGHVVISSTTTIDSIFNDSVGHNNGSAGRRLPNVVFRLGPDTLSIKSVAIQYRMALQQLGLKMPFVIKHLLIMPVNVGDNRWLALPEDTEVNDKINNMSSFSDTLYTDRIRINPMHGYAAMFLNMRFNVLKDMVPEILFSVFLTFITLSTFWITYTYIGKQEQLMMMKNDFISNVTHELKTPVATVSVALEALRDFNALENPVRTKEYLSIAQNELNRLILMTDNILKTAVFEQKGLKFIPEKVSLTAIVEHVLSSMKLVFEKRAIRINYLPAADICHFTGSEMHLTSVIYNLVDNAVKYSHDHSEVNIALGETPEGIKFSVSDHGIGIKKEHHQKVFDKFFRVMTGDVHTSKGYGLGLYYVAEVIKSHGGQIRVESTFGLGSCFTFTLPSFHVGH